MLTNYKKVLYYWLFLSTVFNKYIFGYVFKEYILYIFTKESTLLFLTFCLKKNEVFNLRSLLDIVVVDLLNITKNGRFLLNYVFWNYINEVRIIIKILNDGRQSIRSLTSLYKSSDWLEREVWDMYGIKFLFHNNLRRILTDYGYKGHPLRKDFPLIGYIDLYYDEVLQGIALKAVEIPQVLRYYEFDNPWNIWKR